MKGLINIITTIIVAFCLHACKAHMRTCVDEVKRSSHSFGSVSNLQSSENIDLWKAASLMSDVKAGTWKHIRIYDTTKPDCPLLMDIEEKDSTQANSQVNINDSVKSSYTITIDDSVCYDDCIDADIHIEKEKDIMETLSDILKLTGYICFCAVIAYGVFVLYKKIF